MAAGSSLPSPSKTPVAAAHTATANAKMLITLTSPATPSHRFAGLRLAYLKRLFSAKAPSASPHVVRHIVQHEIDPGAKIVERPHRRDRDQRCDQRIFDGI